MATDKKTAEDLFHDAWLAHGLKGCDIEREHVFHVERKWRVDFLIRPHLRTEALIAVEIEGWGRHQRFVGFMNDCEKYNMLTAKKYRLFRYPAAVVSKDPEAIVENLVSLLCGVFE